MRPILIGMSNPYGSEPAHALFPVPASSAGGRLWAMLHDVRPELSRHSYISRFDRRNLCNGPWVSAAGHRNAGAMLPFPPGSQVVLLGDAVRRAFGLRPLLLHPCPDFPQADVTVRQLPHPSGRNLFYNDPTHRLLAGLLLSELYDGGRQ